MLKETDDINLVDLQQWINSSFQRDDVSIVRYNGYPRRSKDINQDMEYSK